VKSLHDIYWTPCALMKRFIHFLVGYNSEAEKRLGELRQQQQLVDSSHRRVQRANENWDYQKHHVISSQDRLKDNLDGIAEKLRKLREATKDDD
jgi:hypothetical protein